jgi:hypothetical protein
MQSRRSIHDDFTYGSSSFDKAGNNPLLFRFADSNADFELIPTEGE